MASVSMSRVSCSMVDLYDLTPNPKRNLWELWYQYIHGRNSNFAWVIFSDAINESNNGTALASYIRNMGIKVIETESVINPNTGNRVVIWMALFGDKPKLLEWIYENDYNADDKIPSYN